MAAEVNRRTFQGALPMPQAEIDASADAGLAVFLRAYRAEVRVPAEYGEGRTR